MQPTQVVLLVAVGLFGAYLLFRFRPGARGVRRKLNEPIRRARERAYAAKTDEARADALAEAGEAASSARRWVAAAGYFLRAMRALPASGEIVRRAGSALTAKPELCESTLWRRLAMLPGDDTHRPAFVAAVTTLAELYEGPLADEGRAKVMRRLATLEATTSKAGE